ncbi:lipopolysaccharide biosynthesis protein [Parablautia sp. Marseille-Q6255]|uniref:lipopolysaccharide biosynthesis protein n=1 Tax=Parablautia sp. Marseille-Q6255 TaxID=3039593 RepID=UPI0024BC9FCC|nr:oligosaccharide flippase family protein [Parablautia sp. Marseille-Q6255]
MSNKEKIRKNFILGICSQILTIILGIVIPRLVLTNYGSEINGLINSVVQVYTYLSLLEAGIGGATIQALYQSLGGKNRDGTNAILSATNKYYHRTGVIYFLVIILFSLIYPVIVDTNIPTITIVLIIIFNGLGSVINYFFQGKYFLLLQAEGKYYIKAGLTMFTDIFRNIAKIVLIVQGFDVVAVQAISMIISIMQMIFMAWYIRKNYEWIDLKVTPDYQSISQSKNVIVHQISTLIFNNTDTIILTLSCGLKTVSIYAMYSMLYSMIKTALNTVTNSVIFMLGQTFHLDKYRFARLHDCFELYYMTLVFCLYSIANFFIEPFLKCYTSGVTDVSYIDQYLPLLFTLVYLLDGGRTACNQAISIAGHFKQTQRRSLIESAINLIVSLVAVSYFGIYGVLLGTIVALLYRTNDMIFYANKRILHRNVWVTYKRWGVNCLIFIIQLFVNDLISVNLNNYINIFVFLIPYATFTVIIYVVGVSLFEPRTAKFAIDLIKHRQR